MRISKIIIENFRSIKKVEITADNFNIFVGQNNHGKTNLFEAIDWFFNGTKKGESVEEIRFGRSGDTEIFVEIEFTGAQNGANRMKNEGNKTKMLNALNGSDTIVAKRNSNDPKKRAVAINGSWLDKVPTGFDNAFNDFLPRFEYVDTKKYFEDVAKFTKTSPVGVMLSGVLTTILEKSEQYQKFRQQFEEIFSGETSDIKIELDNLSGKVKIYLEKQFPDCTKVAFEVAPPIFDDLLKNFDTTIDDGIETRATEKGDGMQRALMLAILQAYADFRKENEDVGKSFMFFIDEAELHLHPTAQRKLKNVLLELSREDDQVFINTHSSVLVADEHDHQKIFRVEKIEKVTNVSPIQENEKPYIVYELLGGSPADLLLPKNFLIVEGKSELELLTRIINRFYISKPTIQIIQANGDLKQAERSINAIEQLFKPLEKSLYKDKTVIIFDQPNKPMALTQFLTNHPDLRTHNQTFELTVGNIEEYYPNHNGWRKTSAEVDTMRGHHKVSLAQQVGDVITQQQFEQNMGIVFNALQKCWELAYN
ncbi:MAG: AAA family ATPase [Candidatus Omnitrophota bacterium]|nr:ATP-binding protein [Candidatus Omnitrophota bacterium]